MRRKELNTKEQVFRYAYEGKTIFIAIDRLIRRIKDKPIVMIPIEELLVKKLTSDKTIDNNYVYKYTKDFSRKLAGEPVDILPALVIKFKDATWTLADGNNKYVAAFMAGAKEIPAWVAERQEWAPFIIRDINPEIPHGAPIL